MGCAIYDELGSLLGDSGYVDRESTSTMHHGL